MNATNPRMVSVQVWEEVCQEWIHYLRMEERQARMFVAKQQVAKWRIIPDIPTR